METWCRDFIKDCVRAHPFTSQKLEIGPKGRELSGYGGALKTTLMQLGEVSSNRMVANIAQPVNSPRVGLWLATLPSVRRCSCPALPIAAGGFTSG
jgi:hypothetical protein